MVVKPYLESELEFDIIGYQYTDLEFTELFEVYFHNQEIFEGFSHILSEIFGNNCISSSNSEEVSIDLVFKYYSEEVRGFNTNFSNYYKKLNELSLFDLIQNQEEIDDQIKSFQNFKKKFQNFDIDNLRTFGNYPGFSIFNQAINAFNSTNNFSIKPIISSKIQEQYDLYNTKANEISSMTIITLKNFIDEKHDLYELIDSYIRGNDSFDSYNGTEYDETVFSILENWEESLDNLISLYREFENRIKEEEEKNKFRKRIKAFLRTFDSKIQTPLSRINELIEEEIDIDIYDDDLEEFILDILAKDKTFGNYNKRSQVFILNEGKNITVGEESTTCPYCLSKNVNDKHIEKCEQEVNEFNRKY